MKALKGNKRKPATRLERQRRGLLAKVHIAKKDLALLDDDYRGILQEEFGVTTAKALTVGELQSLVRRFESKGWRGKARYAAGGAGQAEALRERAEGLAAEAGLEGNRLRGLLVRICGVERLEWCQDVYRLKRLLAAMNKIKGR
jgi:phage gp16-like protein